MASSSRRHPIASSPYSVYSPPLTPSSTTQDIVSPTVRALDRSIGAVAVFAISLLLVREAEFWSNRLLPGRRPRGGPSGDGCGTPIALPPASHCASLIFQALLRAARSARALVGHPGVRGSADDGADEAPPFPPRPPFGAARGSCQCRTVSFSIAKGPAIFPPARTFPSRDVDKCSFRGDAFSVDARRFRLRETASLPKKGWADLSVYHVPAAPPGGRRGGKRAHVFCRRCGVHIFRVHREEGTDGAPATVLEVNWRCVDDTTVEDDNISECGTPIGTPMDNTIFWEKGGGSEGVNRRSDKASSLGTNTTEDNSISVSAESSSVASSDLLQQSHHSLASLTGSDLCAGLFLDREDGSFGVTPTPGQGKRVGVDRDVQKSLVRHMSHHLGIGKSRTTLPSPAAGVISVTVPVIGESWNNGRSVGGG